MLFALSRCGEGDVTLALELPLALDLAVQGFLVASLLRRSLRLHSQERVSPLGEAPAKTLAWCAGHLPGSGALQLKDAQKLLERGGNIYAVGRRP